MVYCSRLIRGVNGMWAEWAIALPGFDRIDGAAEQQPGAALLLAHPALDSYLRPCYCTSYQFSKTPTQQLRSR